MGREICESPSSTIKFIEARGTKASVSFVMN